MALSGSFSNDYVGDYFGLKVDWSGTQDVSNNSTTITIRVYLHVRDIQVGSRFDNTVTVNGVTQTYNTQSLDEPPGTHYTLLTADPLTFTVPHNADGTKTVSISVLWKANLTYSGNWIGEMTAAQSVTLDRIARASTLTVPSTMKMGTEQTFTITRQDNSFTHALSYNFLGETGNIPVNDTTPKWTPSEDLASRITTSTSGALTLTLVTYSGTTEIGRNVYNKTLYVPDDMKPTATIDSVSVVNENNTVDGWGIALQGYSQIGWSVSGEGANDSTITGYEITIDGKTYTTETGTSDILQSTNGKVSARVRDSRGRWSDVEENNNTAVFPYAPPSISVNDVYRSDDQGNRDPTNGRYIFVDLSATFSDADGNNRCGRLARYKKAGGNDWEEMRFQYTDISSRINVDAIDLDKAYYIELEASDRLGNKSTTVIYTIPTAVIAMNIRKGGTGAAFGKYAEHDKALELPGDWNIRFGDKTLLELVYPVGSIYMSVNGADPAGLFGGTWVRIKDRFLLSAGDTYTAGDTGGAATVTLTKEQMPTHNHGAKSLTGAAGDIMTDAVDGRWSTSGIISSANPGRTRDFSGLSGASGLRGIEVNATHTHNDEGGGLAHNNMPPYLVVYVWERTA